MTDDDHDWWGGEDGGLWHCRRCGRCRDGYRLRRRWAGMGGSTHPGLPVTPARTAGDAAGTLVVHPGVVGLMVAAGAAGRYQDSHLSPPISFPVSPGNLPHRPSRPRGKRHHHRAKGTTAKDWTASWRTWMRNAQKWSRTTRRQPPTPPAGHEH